MNTFLTALSHSCQSNAAGRWVARHRFLIGIAAGALISVGLTGDWSRLTMTSLLTILLVVAPCALMMGLCMGMVRHTERDKPGLDNAQTDQSLESAQPVQTFRQTPRAALPITCTSGEDHV